MKHLFVELMSNTNGRLLHKLYFTTFSLSTSGDGMCSIKVSELGTFYAEDFLHYNSLKKLFHIRNVE